VDTESVVQLIVGTAAVCLVGLASWALIELVNIKTTIAGLVEKMVHLDEWAKNVDKGLVENRLSAEYSKERLSWGAKKISLFSRNFVAVSHEIRQLKHKVGKLEEKL
jgi:hypothetical protein